MAQAYLDSLTPRERARDGWQPELSIWEIAVETFPGDHAKQRRLAESLEHAVTTKALAPAPGWRQRAQAHEALVVGPVALKVPGL